MIVCVNGDSSLNLPDAMNREDCARVAFTNFSVIISDTELPISTP
jgi:hypothetical protein